MAASYTEQDYINMVRCFLDCDNNAVRASLLYYTRYGLEPATETISKAVMQYGDSETLHVMSQGTSAVEEDDKSVINIKKEINQEPEEVTVEKDNNNIDDETLALCAMSESCPIVYTTRLDDMFIFQKDFERLDLDDIVKNVIHESKPKLKELPVNRNTTKHIINPFFRLVENVRKFNELAKQTEHHDVEDISLYLNEKSRRLLKQCKPSFVVLVDCNMKSSYSENNSNLTETYKPTRNINNLRNFRKEYFVLNTLVFYDYKKRTSEIYFVDKLTTIISCIFLNYLVFKNKSLPHFREMKNCCWYGRESGIDSLVGYQRCGRITSDLMRKPHLCPPGQCTCCCKSPNEDLNHSIVQGDTISTKKGNMWYNNLKAIHANQNCTKKMNCINEALNYSRNPDQDTKSKFKTSTKLNTEIQIINCYLNTTDSFLLDDKGIVTKYIEVKSDDPTRYSRPKLTYLRDKVCCWRKRDWLLWLLHKNHAYNSLNFIRASHTCPANDCRCCCKPEKLPPTLKRIPCSNYAIIPKTLVHAKKYSNTFFTLRKDLHKQFSSSNAKTVVVKKSNYCETSTQTNSNPPTKTVQKPLSNSGQSSATAVKQYLIQLPPSLIPTNNNKTPHTSGLQIGGITQRHPSSILKNSVHNLIQLPSTSSSVNFNKTSDSTDLQNRVITQLNPVSSPTTAFPVRINTPFSVNLAQVNNPSTASKFQNISPLPATLVSGNPFPTATPAKTNTRSTATFTQVYTHSKPKVQPSVNQSPSISSYLQSNNVQDSLLLPKTTLGTENLDPTVNSLVTSILDRFKDVRLTISPDGDVSAELKTPIQDLSTSELKILSAILAHAKEQVKALKSNGGLPPTNVLNNTSIISSMAGTPTINASTAFVSNNNFRPPVTPSVPNTPSVIPTTTPINRATKQLDKIYLQPRDSSINTTDKHLNRIKTDDPYLSFTNLSALKSRQYLESCKHYINNAVTPGLPKIDQIYSLNDTEQQVIDDPISVSGPSGVKRRQVSSTSKLNTGKAKKRRTCPKPGTRKQNAQANLTPVPTLSSEIPIPLFSGTPSYQIITPPEPIITDSLLSSLVSSPFVPPSIEPVISTDGNNAVDENDLITIPNNLFMLDNSLSNIENQSDCSAVKTEDDDCILGC